MSTEEIRGWFTGRLPKGMFDDLVDSVDLVVDREEITVVGRIPTPDVAADASDAVRAATVDGAVSEFRERTRADRVAVAREAEHRFGRKVSWGVECDGRRTMFTTLAVPTMTRLRQGERQVLDLLVEGGVARSRSDALGWCVRLVQRHADDWLAELKESLVHVQRVRERGPDGSAA